MKKRIRASLMGIAAVAALAACAPQHEAQVRQFRLVMVGTDRAALQAALSSAPANEFARPFQAEGKCKAAIWLPRLSVIAERELAAAQPQPLDLGFFDKVEFVRATQNAVQSALGQKPTLAELDQAAARMLSAYQLPVQTAPAESSAQTGPADHLQAARKLAGKNGLVLFKDEAAQLKAAVKPPVDGGGPATADAMLPEKPLAFPDALGYRSQVHDLLCGLPAQDGAAIPTVVVLGVAGNLSSAGGAAVAHAPPDAVKPLSVKAPAVSANSQRAFDRGMILIHQGDLEQALKEFNSAIELEPNFPAAVANRGVAHLKLKNYGRALDDLNRAVGMEPQNPVWHYNLAAYYALRHEPDRGLDALDQALKLGFAKTDNVQIDALKFNSRADPDLAALRQRKTEYCALLERHQKFLCK